MENYKTDIPQDIQHSQQNTQTILPGVILESFWTTNMGAAFGRRPLLGPYFKNKYFKITPGSSCWVICQAGDRLGEYLLSNFPRPSEILEIVISE